MESYIRRAFSFYYLLLAIPYTLSWEPGLQIQFSLKPSSKHFKAWLFGCLVLFLHIFAVWFTLFHFLGDYFAAKSYDKLAFHSVWAVCSICMFFHQLLHLRMPHEVMQLQNGCFEIIRNLERYHFHYGCFKNSQLVRARILFFLAMNSLTSWWFFVLIYYLFRQEYWQLGSFLYRLLLLAGISEPVASVFGVALDLLHLFNIWGSYLLSLHVNLGFMHTFKTAVELMLTQQHRRNGSTSQAFGFSSQSRFQEQMLIYSKLRILTTVYNNVYGIMYVPMIKSCCSVMTVMCVFISVRLAPISSPLVGIFGIGCTILVIICMSIFIIFMSMVNEYSVKLGNYLKGEKLQGAMARRLLRSFREEMVKSGQLYGIQRMTCLTVLGLLSNMCGSVLISFKI